MLAPMAESVDDLQPWPRAGETWAPVLPWPRAECPAGFYTHGYSTLVLDPKNGAAGRRRAGVCAAHHHAAVAQAQKVIDSAATAAGAVNWPPGYSGQVIGTAGSDGVKFAFSVNDDLNPFTHPEQIGRMPPDDRLRDTPDACVAAAWAHYRANGGST